MRYLIGVDVGGTNIKAVLMDAKGKVVRKIIKKTEKKHIEEEIIDLIKDLIEKSMINKKEIKGVGVGFPGLIDKKRERINILPNIKSFNDRNIKKHLQKKTGLKTRIENDAKCSAIAESMFGSGKKQENFVLLTIGTGIGGGIIINNNLYIGEGNAGEFGHITIQDPGGRKCSCGNKGCLEEYISKKGIMKNAEEAGIDISKIKDLYQLYELAKKGNKKALKTFENSGVYLGKGLSHIVKSFDPEAIIINGGIANSSKFIFPYARKEMKKGVFFKTNCKIKKGKFGDFAGAVGAGCLWL